MPAQKGNKYGLKHGMSKTPQYVCWTNMKKRCDSRKYYYYHRYGGRGITYHTDFETFESWWAHVRPMWEAFVKNNPNDTPTINRIDNNDDYTYGNIEFVSKSYNTKQRNIDSGNPSILNKIQIIGVDKKMGVTRQYESQVDAEKQIGVFAQNINACLKGRQKSAGGYLWFYK